MCVTYNDIYVYSINSIDIYGKHCRVCYSVNYVKKINEVNVFNIKHTFRTTVEKMEGGMKIIDT